MGEEVTTCDEYRALFEHATRGLSPYPYQIRLATESWPNFLDIPTGLGKTAAVTLSWLFKRGWRPGGQHLTPDPDTPRRLVWCLPMRVLVEQTDENIRGWADNLRILGDAGQGRISIHMLMGGEPDLKTWAEHPEEDMIIIGTQDMLLSRALMRGYGMSRYLWPVHFALLHNDSLWAFDEVQLLGAGLTTSAQLEAFRRRFPLSKASRSLWLSATLRRDWLATVDLAPHLPDFTTLELSAADHEQAGERLNARKTMLCTEVAVTAETGKKAGLAAYTETLAQAVLDEHEAGGQTLVILNRVERAQELFRRIHSTRADRDDLLVHARFRPAERAAQNQRLGTPATDRIIVATQAIEAGVDISSQVLLTELAPWASLVQRFGRCNRYGEHNDTGGARVLWIDIADDADPLPYTADSLELARDKLLGLEEVSPTALPTADEARPLTAVLRRKDLLDLFNTDPDLSGFDVDVSDYIRDSGNPGLHVFWRDFVDPNDPLPQPSALRQELCPVGLSQARELHKRKSGAWRWDSLAGQWQRLQAPPRPGTTLLLASNDGGYDPVLGFDADAKSAVKVVGGEASDQHEEFGDDWRSRTRIPVPLSDHLAHAATAAQSLCASVGETGHGADVIRADRWHDLGKAHEVFDQTMHRCPAAPSGLLAKSNCPGPVRHSRRHFRHELASALAWLAQHDDPGGRDPRVDLIAYLIASHHGKVRMSLRAMPTEQPAPDNARFARGIWEGDRLPGLQFDGEISQAVDLKLALMELGEGEQGCSWAARVLALLNEHGPFRLAWLETLVRLADWRASAAEQLATSSSLDQNAHHGLENQHPPLATARSPAATPDPSGEAAAQGGAQHGLRRRAGGSDTAGTRAATPDHATRQLETSLGVLSYAALAPHLALRVERTAVAIANGELDEHPLDDHLICELHRRICGDLTPQFAGRWRRINVLVGTHEPPVAAVVPMTMRDYAADLDARIRHLATEPDDGWLETLAFAEGRLLSIHPFEDFNGRTARLFIDLLLQRLNLPAIDPIPTYGQPTEDYLAALRAADRHNWQPLKDIWSERLEEQGND